MRHFLIAAVLAGLPVSAVAQEAAQAAAPDARGLRLTVRPSGYETEQNDAQARQEKLLKRLEQSDHMIRSICVNCGDSWKHQLYEPFYPYASLKPSARPSDDPVE